MSSVGDHDLHRVPLADQAGKDMISFSNESCMASAALSTRLAIARFMASGSAWIGGRSGARDLCTRIPSSLPSNISSAWLTMLLMSEACGRDAGKRARDRELIHQGANSFHRRANGLGALPNDVQRSRIRRRSAFEVPANALRRQCNWGERVLDFVRNRGEPPHATQFASARATDQ